MTKWVIFSPAFLEEFPENSQTQFWEENCLQIRFTRASRYMDLHETYKVSGAEQLIGTVGRTGPTPGCSSILGAEAFNRPLQGIVKMLHPNHTMPYRYEMTQGSAFIEFP